jgi:hypothetical protein
MQTSHFAAKGQTKNGNKLLCGFQKLVRWDFDAVDEWHRLPSNDNVWEKRTRHVNDNSEL